MECFGFTFVTAHEFAEIIVHSDKIHFLGCFFQQTLILCFDFDHFLTIFLNNFSDKAQDFMRIFSQKRPVKIKRIIKCILQQSGVLVFFSVRYRIDRLQGMHDSDFAFITAFFKYFHNSCMNKIHVVLCLETFMEIILDSWRERTADILLR